MSVASLDVVWSLVVFSIFSAVTAYPGRWATRRKFRALANLAVDRYRVNSDDLAIPVAVGAILREQLATDKDATQ